MATHHAWRAVFTKSASVKVAAPIGSGEGVFGIVDSYPAVVLAADRVDRLR